MGEHDLFQKIGFIGLGLIGGSIAKKIHTLYPDVTIIATAGHQETITEAYGEHLISNQNLCEIKDFYDFTTDDLIVENYQTWPQIKNIPIAV